VCVCVWGGGSQMTAREGTERKVGYSDIPLPLALPCRPALSNTLHSIPSFSRCTPWRCAPLALPYRIAYLILMCGDSGWLSGCLRIRAGLSASSPVTCCLSYTVSLLSVSLHHQVYTTEACAIVCLISCRRDWRYRALALTPSPHMEVIPGLVVKTFALWAEVPSSIPGPLRLWCF
jgi:hypothetical protein